MSTCVSRCDTSTWCIYMRGEEWAGVTARLMVVIVGALCRVWTYQGSKLGLIACQHLGIKYTYWAHWALTGHKKQTVNRLYPITWNNWVLEPQTNPSVVKWESWQIRQMYCMGFTLVLEQGCSAHRPEETCPEQNSLLNTLLYHYMLCQSWNSYDHQVSPTIFQN